MSAQVLPLELLRRRTKGCSPFSPWSFSADMKTFSMANTFVTKSEQPKQTAYIAVAGREVRRSCANPKPCR